VIGGSVKSMAALPGAGCSGWERGSDWSCYSYGVAAAYNCVRSTGSVIGAGSVKFIGSVTGVGSAVPAGTVVPAGIVIVVVVLEPLMEIALLHSA